MLPISGALTPALHLSLTLWILQQAKPLQRPQLLKSNFRTIPWCGITPVIQQDAGMEGRERQSHAATALALPGISTAKAAAGSANVFRSLHTKFLFFTL